MRQFRRFSPNTKQKKKKYEQKLSDALKCEYQFLKPSTNRSRYAFFQTCRNDINIGAGKVDVGRHIKTEKHQDTKKYVQKQLKFVDMKKVNENNIMNDKVSYALIRYLAFIAEHNVASNTCDNMPDLFRDMFPDSEIAKRLYSTRIKTTAIRLTKFYDERNSRSLLAKAQI